jgi:hypothetical protein
MPDVLVLYDDVLVLYCTKRQELAIAQVESNIKCTFPFPRTGNAIISQILCFPPQRTEKSIRYRSKPLSLWYSIGAKVVSFCRITDMFAQYPLWVLILIPCPPPPKKTAHFSIIKKYDSAPSTK